MPNVDVVVPCYNYGRYLDACLGSILGQSMRDVRVLVIDDASSDDSYAIASNVAAADPRVSVVRHSHNQGHIASYNEGIAWAEADCFLVLSADDMLLPGALDRAATVLGRNPDVVLAYGRCIDWSDDLPFPDLHPEETFAYERLDLVREVCATATNFVPTPTAVARTSVQKGIGGYRHDLPHSGDLEMWLRFGVHGAVARIDAFQGVYRKHSSAMSNAYWTHIQRDYRERKRAFDTFFADFGHRRADAAELKRSADREMARQAVRSAVSELGRLRIGDALQLIRWAGETDRHLHFIDAIRVLFRAPAPEVRNEAVRAHEPALDPLSRLLPSGRQRPVGRK